MTDSILQPFKRNLNVNPVLIPIGVTGIATPIPAMTGDGVTTFKMHNPNPFWVWYRGWSGDATAMPTVKGMGHYIAPGATDICRTQMPQWIAAAGAEEPDLPLYPSGSAVITDPADGCIKWNNVRCRLIMIYGSGS